MVISIRWVDRHSRSTTKVNGSTSIDEAQNPMFGMSVTAHVNHNLVCTIGKAQSKTTAFPITPECAYFSPTDNSDHNRHM